MRRWVDLYVFVLVGGVAATVTYGLLRDFGPGALVAFAFGCGGGAAIGLSFRHYSRAIREQMRDTPPAHGAAAGRPPVLLVATGLYLEAVAVLIIDVVQRDLGFPWVGRYCWPFGASL
jgi:hypothetical protein